MILPNEVEKPEQLIISLELLANGAYESDLLFLTDIWQEVISALQQNGYQVPQSKSGTRGTEFLSDILTMVQSVRSSSALVERGLNDVSSLVTVCTGVIPVLMAIMQAHKRRTASSQKQSPLTPPTQPVKMTIEIDGAPVSVEAADLEQAEAALLLAQRFVTRHPVVAKNVTTSSKTKVQGQLPAKSRRRRR